MRVRISERGSVLLLEMLIVVSILGVLLVFSAPSFMQMRMSQQANQALYTLRAIQNAEAYCLQIYHSGYVDPGVLTGTGIAVPPTCDAPLLLGGAQAQTQTNGYFFQFTPDPARRDRDKPRSLVTNAVRRGPSSAVSAVNLNPSPLPGFTCRTTASALICPS